MGSSTKRFIKPFPRELQSTSATTTCDVDSSDYGEATPAWTHWADIIEGFASTVNFGSAGLVGIRHRIVGLFSFRPRTISCFLTVGAETQLGCQWCQARICCPRSFFSSDVSVTSPALRSFHASTSFCLIWRWIGLSETWISSYQFVIFCTCSFIVQNWGLFRKCCGSPHLQGLVSP